VFLNGVKLDKTDYTATSGTSIVLDSGASANDTLEILAFDTFGLFSGEFAQDVSVGGDLTASDDIKMTSDSAQIAFGADSEVTLTHVADTGLTLKHTATADDKPINLTLATGETDMAANDVLGKISFQAPDEGTGTDAILVSGAVQARAEGDFSSSSNATSLDFMTGASEAATTKMTLTSAGALGIGTTSPSSATGFTTGTVLDVANVGTAGDATDNAAIRASSANRHALLQLKAKNDKTSFIYFGDGDDDDVGKIQYDHASNFMSFTINTNEAMRIDASPQVLMGKTVANLTSAGSIQAANATSDGSPAYFYMIKTFDGTRNAWLNYHSGTYIGGININNNASEFLTSSDERLKKNIVDAPSAGDKIDAMQVRSFNWKSDDSFQEYGLIAQELEPIYDLPVSHHDTEDTLSVDYSKLVPVLLKEIQDLRKRVATLENS